MEVRAHEVDHGQPPHQPLNAPYMPRIALKGDGTNDPCEPQGDPDLREVKRDPKRNQVTKRNEYEPEPKGVVPEDPVSNRAGVSPRVKNPKQQRRNEKCDPNESESTQDCELFGHPGRATLPRGCVSQLIQKDFYFRLIMLVEDQTNVN